jgi:hypothetical protein
MNEQWEYFPFQAEESVGTVVYNHGLSASINELPIHQSVRFKLKFKSPNAEGLPDAAESKTAELLETRIESELAERSGIYTGRVTFEGRRLFYSYVQADEASIATLVASLGKEFKCNLEYDVRDDPDDVLSTLPPDGRVTMDLSVTTEPDDFVFRKGDDVHKNYSATEKWLRRFVVFCRTSGGFSVL